MSLKGPKPTQATPNSKALAPKQSLVPPPTLVSKDKDPAENNSGSRFQGYTVHRRESGVAKMAQGERSWEEPQIWARITDPKGRAVVGRELCLNSMLCCIPGGHVRGVDATNEQLLEAVLGDESVFGPGYGR